MFHLMKKAIASREVIWALATRMVAERYAGTLGGLLWEIIHPLAMVCVFWFVFEVGFRAQGPVGMPFILYFISGMVPWLFFSSVLGGGTAAITANAYLAKKTLFPTEVMPFVYILSAVITHGILLVIILGVTLAYDWPLKWTLLQLPYYFGAMCCLLVGLVWLTSALNAFNRDVAQMVRVITEIWFWATPVVWSAEMLPESLHWIVYFNPMYFVVHGYRDSLLLGGAFWDDGISAVVFWFVAFFFIGIGSYVFSRLKPQFADVL